MRLFKGLWMYLSKMPRNTPLGCAKLAGQVPKDQWPAIQPHTMEGWSNTPENWFCFSLAQAMACPTSKPFRKMVMDFYQGYYNGRDAMKIFVDADPFTTFPVDPKWMKVILGYMANPQLMAYHKGMGMWPCDGIGCQCYYDKHHCAAL